jgi:hypothetical protein
MAPGHAVDLAESYSTSIEVLNELAFHSDSCVREAVARNIKTSPLLEDIVKYNYDDPSVLYYIKTNSKCSDELRKLVDALMFLRTDV